jgi:hypothetical protein
MTQELWRIELEIQPTGVLERHEIYPCQWGLPGEPGGSGDDGGGVDEVI